MSRLPGAASILALAATLLAAAQPVPAPARVPVVVELFTSEGCSSCPPADALLSKLLRDQPVAGAKIVPLGLHVTYWDQQGWKDPASLEDATRRQQDYSRVFGPDRVYTPQAVVDGGAETIGSDENNLRRAIAKAAALPHALLSVTATDTGGRIVASAVVTKPIPVNERLHGAFFITEDGITSVVKRGENGGRTLRHDAVVRRVSVATEDQPTASGPPMAVVFSAIPAEWHRDRLHVIAILQGEKTRRIWAAAMAPEIRQ
jgi:hypothetical protein